MESTSTNTSSGTDRGDATLELDALKKNPQLQQLLLMTLSAIKQQQQQQQDDTVTKGTTLDNDKRKFDQLDTHSLSADTAALSDHGSPGSDSSSEKGLGRPGRKPLSEDEIRKSEMDPKSKRKAQNRAAQRAFRERRVNYVKELEDRIKALEEGQDETTEKVRDENKQLKKIIQQLQVENAILGGTASSFDIPLSKQLYSADDGSNLESNTERPQKLLRSIGENSNATLLSATTTTHHQQLYDTSPESSLVSFAAPSHPDATNELSPSLSSNQSITSPDIYNNNEGLSSTALPTDILNTLDASQLLQSFGLDANPIAPELFNTLTTNTPLSIPTKSSTSASSSSSSSSPQSLSTATMPLSNTNDTTSNEWLESLLVVDDDDTDSSSSPAAPSTTTAQNGHQNYTNSNNDEHQSLPQVWDELTKHPRFDEFDIDFLCDEMKRKVRCDDGKPCDNKSHQQKIQETVHKYYPNPSFS